MSRPPDDAPVEQRIGPELKRLREAAGLSLRTLADRAGFSASFMSQVENGQVSPSIASLSQIAATLNLTLADFFAAPATAPTMVVRAGARPSFRSSWSRARIDALTPLDKDQPLEALMVTLEPGGASGKVPVGVAADQLALVYSGRPTLTLEEEVHALNKGDSVVIRARTPHRWQNDRSTAARIVLVSTRVR